MKRPVHVTLTFVGLLTFLTAAACNSETSPDDNDGGNGKDNAAGTAGTGALVLPTAGSGNDSAGTGNATPTGGTGAVATAGTSSGGAATGGTAAGGASAGGSAGGATGGAPTNPGNPNCPLKIDSKVACTQVVSCPDAYCGVFQMGAKDCDCAAASGMFTCTSCDYAGRTEEIVLPPAAVLPACAADDTTLEKNTPNCSKGMRCKSLTADKARFCACWEDPVDGALVWDCDAMPSSWPK